MADVVDKETRSRMMSGIRGKDTKPELILRRALHARNLRFRLHPARMPGRPDLVFPKYRAAIFVHGCFWHRHEDCRYATTPATRPEFWREKFLDNVERDQRNIRALRGEGWRVAVIWECRLRRTDRTIETVDRVEAWILGRDDFLEVGEPTTAPASVASEPSNPD